MQYLLEVEARKKQPPSLIKLNRYSSPAGISGNQYLGQLRENTPGQNKNQTRYQNE